MINSCKLGECAFCISICMSSTQQEAIYIEVIGKLYNYMDISTAVIPGRDILIRPILMVLPHAYSHTICWYCRLRRSRKYSQHAKRKH